ncbi:MAG TPA: hypothetical protein VLV78_07495 [Thermoanaerobaculia bacterium]|nr:hypothetical protein [Thermoanaerobaculia bacterium]
MRRSILVALLLVSFGVACKGRVAPPAVDKWTSCAVDGNRLEDLSLAAVARSSDGQVKAFDRAACLLQAIPEGDQWQVWFHDNDGPDWIEASKVVFVIQRTSAGGPIRAIRAFKNRAGADAFYQRTPGRNEIAPDYATLRGVVAHE